MNSAIYNNKTLLQITLPNKNEQKISIIYLDNQTNTVHHTQPATNITLFNTANNPARWMFLKKGKQLEDSTSRNLADLYFVNITDTTRSTKQKMKNPTIQTATNYTISYPRNGPIT